MIKKLIFLAILLLSLIFGAVVIIQSDSFRQYALSKLNTYIEKTTKGSVKIEKIEVTFPFKVVLTNISLESMSIDYATCSLSLRKLAQGKIQVKHLFINEFEIKTDPDTKIEDIKPFVIPEIPDYFTAFKLEKLEINQLKFHNHLLNITGKILTDTNNHSININLDVTSDEFSKITSQISLKMDEKGLNADITLNHLSNTLKTKVIVSEKATLYLENLNCNLDKTVNCDAKELKLLFSPFRIIGKINGQLEDYEIKGIKTSGKITFTGNFTAGDNNTQHLKMLFKSKKLESNGFNAQNIRGSALIKNLYKFNSADFIISAEKIGFQGADKTYKISDFNFKSHMDNTFKNSTFSMKIAENQHFNLKINTAGTYDFKKDRLLITFEELKGFFLNQKINIEKPFILDLEQDLIEASPIFATFGTAFLTTSFKKSAENNAIKLTLNSFPAHLISSEIKDGLFDADIDLSGSNLKPTGKISVKFQELKTSIHSLNNISPLQAEFMFDVQEKDWQLEGTIKEQNQNPIFVKATIPVLFSFTPFSLTLDKQAKFSSNFTLDGNLAPLVELFKEEASNLSGVAKLSIDVEGTFDEPHVKGFAQIDEGTFEIPETCALYKNINAKFEVYDNELHLKELTATDAFEGKIKAVGNVDLNLKEHFPFSFDIEIENTKLLRLDYATASGNGLLKLIGNLKGALLEGKVIAEDAKVRIPEESPIHISEVEVVYINEEENEIQKNSIKKKAAPWPLALNLIFEIKHPFSIKGSNLKSEWRGSLKIKGTSSKPEIFGEFKIVDGEYKFNGKVFEIHEGTISFSGEPDKKTSLYVIGSHEISNIRADVILKGPLNSPSISFRSNPPMPQREILSWILFGHGAKDLNAFEGSRLNQSITDLNKGSKGPDLLTKIRNKIGIDTIDFNHNSEGENNEVSVKVGKYISRGILVSVNKSFSADANRLEIEAKLIKDIKVQAEIGDDASGQLNLKWKKDY